ncbi:MAG TPA: DUF1684 domain-containing protein [Flavisolibacter sp.]
MRSFLMILLLVNTAALKAQDSYHDSISQYHLNYIKTHEVVKGADKDLVQFFAPDKSYLIKARFEPVDDAPWIPFATSGKFKKNYRVYGKLHFTINDTAVQLNIYQSQDLLRSPSYKDYLFLPFTDATTGNETYDAGRYIDLRIEDTRTPEVIIDFNKAYNPYCAYVSGIYNCPIPPKENRLPVAIRAGEMKFLKE